MVLLVVVKRKHEQCAPPTGLASESPPADRSAADAEGNAVVDKVVERLWNGCGTVV